MKPNILISGSDISRANYENAIAAAGGSFGSYYLPALEQVAADDSSNVNASRRVSDSRCACGNWFACTDDFLSAYDGLLLAGGGDINPALFGQENTASDVPDDARDEIELELIRHFMKAGKPILGICRGFQIMNVALGGTLHQDVGDAGHRIHTPEPDDKIHLTRAAEFSFLGQAYGPVFSVNSAHHQSIDRLADPLLAIQWALEDGCVEGAFHPSYPYIGVQWHPERMCLAKKREDTVDGLAVFRYFLSKFF